VRISLLNDFYFEVEPVGELLLIENEDKPGVIGDVGHFLASRQINIDSFNLSRNRRGGHAMAIIKVDGSVSPEIVQAMLDIKNVVKVHSVAL
jgi:D-3-phosphoglycerate dehydrogenase